MDTQKKISYNADWFPDWMFGNKLLRVTCVFWIGVLQYFQSTHHSVMCPSYDDIANAAKKVLPDIRPVSKTTFERARHDLKGLARKTKDSRLEMLIPKPSAIRGGTRPPWVDDPSLFEQFPGVTMPLPEVDGGEIPDDEVPEGTPLITLQGMEFVAGSHGYVRVRRLQRVRDWLDHTHSIAAVFLGLIMLATWAEWLDPDGDGMIDILQFALQGSGFLCQTVMY